MSSGHRSERKLQLLALDGGGVRGLATLYMLNALMHNLGDKKPCEHFDMIVGTSTGGLIAIMLGCLEMSVEECIDAFITMMEPSFERQRLLSLSLGLELRPRYSTRKLETSIRRIIQDRLKNPEVAMRRQSAPQCRTAVVAIAHDTNGVKYFTNYKRPIEPSRFYDDVKIWEAARATSAAATYFDPITIGGTTFSDGGLQRNCPLDSLWQLAHEQWATSECPLEPQVRCVLSVRTGHKRPEALGSNVKSFVQSLVEIATQSENTARVFYSNHRELVDRGGFYRFNPLFLDEVGLADAKSQSEIRVRTEEYMGDDPEVREKVTRFWKASGGEIDSIAPVLSRKFYDLTEHEKHIRPGMNGYWQRLTLAAYEIYERVAWNCQERSGRADRKISYPVFRQTFYKEAPTADHIKATWTRMLRTRDLDINRSLLPIPMVMAVLYMLHMELKGPGSGPGDIDEDRRNALKRYDYWINCKCGRECRREWNFVNDIGLSRPADPKRRCGIDSYLQSRPGSEALYCRERHLIRQMREEWGVDEVR